MHNIVVQILLIFPLFLENTDGFAILEKNKVAMEIQIWAKCCLVFLVRTPNIAL